MGEGPREREVDITKNQSEEESQGTSSQQHPSKCLQAYLKILWGFSAGLGFILVYRNYGIRGLSCISQYLILGILNQMKNVLFSNHFACNLITKRKVNSHFRHRGRVCLVGSPEGDCIPVHICFPKQPGKQKGEASSSQGDPGEEYRAFPDSSKAEMAMHPVLRSLCGWSHLGSLSRIRFYLTPSSQNTHRCPNKLIQTHPTQLVKSE